MRNLLSELWSTLRGLLMKPRISTLLVIGLLYVSTGAKAVWEYSLEQRAAMTEAAIEVCGPINPVGAKAAQEEFERTLGADELKNLPLTRNEPEYKSTYAATLKEAKQRTIGTPDAQSKECRVILRH